MTFIDYASRIINWTLERIIRNEIGNTFTNRNYTVFIMSHTDYESTERNSLREISPSSPFNLRTILIAITLANLILILGGNIYNFITVESTKDQYLKAKEEVLEMNFNLKNLVTDLKLKELEARSKIEALPNKLENEYSEKLIDKRDSIISQMKSIDSELTVLSDSLGYYKDPAKTVIQLVEPVSENEKSVQFSELDNRLIIVLALLHIGSLILILILFRVKKRK